VAPRPRRRFDGAVTPNDLVELMTAFLMTGVHGLVAGHFPIDPRYPAS
jgi:hypothetical protein